MARHSDGWNLPSGSSVGRGLQGLATSLSVLRPPLTRPIRSSSRLRASRPRACGVPLALARRASRSSARVTRKVVSACQLGFPVAGIPWALSWAGLRGEAEPAGQPADKPECRRPDRASSVRPVPGQAIDHRWVATIAAVAAGFSLRGAGGRAH